ncbi:ankyrin repeat domain-containing protein [Candidatus Neoehrlichia procyonis]|uniref:Ankyrin repeats family protein n=1 Tax=Candidatus Neoehrlichia procyonis str. RAC413 TaxID=1359163 RepID=A0A0F3NLH7_9RICK|nr:ankyrin repeat domain-containing protein [Candidatus Neoehrlichia lotoris]KJV68900.1 ankyrin repeats family protein [Candidatus Neoehrlichia lotoris str. RAC413]
MSIKIKIGANKKSVHDRLKINKNRRVKDNIYTDIKKGNGNKDAQNGSSKDVIYSNLSFLSKDKGDNNDKSVSSNGVIYSDVANTLRGVPKKGSNELFTKEGSKEENIYDDISIKENIDANNFNVNKKKKAAESVKGNTHNDSSKDIIYSNLSFSSKDKGDNNDKSVSSNGVIYSDVTNTLRGVPKKGSNELFAKEGSKEEHIYDDIGIKEDISTNVNKKEKAAKNVKGNTHNDSGKDIIYSNLSSLSKGDNNDKSVSSNGVIYSDVANTLRGVPKKGSNELFTKEGSKEENIYDDIGIGENIYVNSFDIDNKNAVKSDKNSIYNALLKAMNKLFVKEESKEENIYDDIGIGENIYVNSFDIDNKNAVKSDKNSIYNALLKAMNKLFVKEESKEEHIYDNIGIKEDISTNVNKKEKAAKNVKGNTHNDSGKDIIYSNLSSLSKGDNNDKSVSSNGVIYSDVTNTLRGVPKGNNELFAKEGSKEEHIYDNIDIEEHIYDSIDIEEHIYDDIGIKEDISTNVNKKEKAAKNVKDNTHNDSGKDIIYSNLSSLSKGDNNDKSVSSNGVIYSDVTNTLRGVPKGSNELFAKEGSKEEHIYDDIDIEEHIYDDIGIKEDISTNVNKKEKAAKNVKDNTHNDSGKDIIYSNLSFLSKGDNNDKSVSSNGVIYSDVTNTLRGVPKGSNELFAKEGSKEENIYDDIGIKEENIYVNNLDIDNNKNAVKSEKNSIYSALLKAVSKFFAREGSKEEHIYDDIGTRNNIYANSINNDNKAVKNNNVKKGSNGKINTVYATLNLDSNKDSVYSVLNKEIANKFANKEGNKIVQKLFKKKDKESKEHIYDDIGIRENIYVNNLDIDNNKNAVKSEKNSIYSALLKAVSKFFAREGSKEEHIYDDIGTRNNIYANSINNDNKAVKNNNVKKGSNGKINTVYATLNLDSNKDSVYSVLNKEIANKFANKEGNKIVQKLFKKKDKESKEHIYDDIGIRENIYVNNLDIDNNKNAVKSEKNSIYSALLKAVSKFFAREGSKEEHIYDDIGTRNNIYANSINNDNKAVKNNNVKKGSNGKINTVYATLNLDSNKDSVYSVLNKEIANKFANKEGNKIVQKLFKKKDKESKEHIYDDIGIRENIYVNNLDIDNNKNAVKSEKNSIYSALLKAVSKFFAREGSKEEHIYDDIGTRNNIYANSINNDNKAVKNNNVKKGSNGKINTVYATLNLDSNKDSVYSVLNKEIANKFANKEGNKIVQKLFKKKDKESKEHIYDDIGIRENIYVNNLNIDNNKNAVKSEKNSIYSALLKAVSKFFAREGSKEEHIYDDIGTRNIYANSLNIEKDKDTDLSFIDRLKKLNGKMNMGSKVKNSFNFNPEENKLGKLNEGMGHDITGNIDNIDNNSKDTMELVTGKQSNKLSIDDDLDPDDIRSLHDAIDNKDLESIKLLLKNEDLANAVRNTILDYATCDYDDICSDEILNVLIENGANYNVVCNDGNTLLSRLLLIKEYSSIGRTLLKNSQTDLSICNVQGNNILQTLLVAGDYESLSLVINTTSSSTLKSLLLQKDSRSGNENFLSHAVAILNSEPNNEQLRSIVNQVMDSTGLSGAINDVQINHKENKIGKLNEGMGHDITGNIDNMDNDLKDTTELVTGKHSKSLLLNIINAVKNLVEDVKLDVFAIYVMITRRIGLLRTNVSPVAVEERGSYNKLSIDDDLDPDDIRSLHDAIDNKDLESIKLLLKNEDLANAVRNTILDYATCDYDDICSDEILNVLIENGANYNVVCNDGNTLLSRLLLIKEYSSIGRTLLKNSQTDLSICNVQGNNILHTLLVAGDYESLSLVINTTSSSTLKSLLLQKDSRSGNENFLSHAVTALNSEPNNEQLRSIVNQVMDFTGLSGAVNDVQINLKENKLGKLNEGMGHDIIGNIDNMDNNSKDTMELVTGKQSNKLSIDDDLDPDDIRSLHDAIDNKDLESIKLLLKNEDLANAVRNTILDYATCDYDDICSDEILNVLIENGANYNVVCNDGNTLLSRLLLIKEYSSIGRTLLKNSQTDLSICNVQGNNILQTLLVAGDYESLSLVINTTSSSTLKSLLLQKDSRSGNENFLSHAVAILNSEPNNEQLRSIVNQVMDSTGLSGAINDVQINSKENKLGKLNEGMGHDITGNIDNMDNDLKDTTELVTGKHSKSLLLNIINAVKNLVEDVKLDVFAIYVMITRRIGLLRTNVSPVAVEERGSYNKLSIDDDLDPDDIRSLHDAIDNKDLESIKLLLKNEDLANAVRNTILDYATCDYDDICSDEILNVLIENGANYNVVCNDGNTLLSRLLLIKEYSSIGRTLLKNSKTDLSICNVQGNNILHTLLVAGDYESLSLVINKTSSSTLKSLLLQKDSRSGNENFLSHAVTALNSEPNNEQLRSIVNQVMDFTGLSGAINNVFDMECDVQNIGVQKSLLSANSSRAMQR